MKALHNVVKKFTADPTDLNHQYLHAMPGEIVGEPHRLYLLAYNLTEMSPEMAANPTYLMYVDIEDTHWPNGPPKGFFLTPNGVYSPGHNICTSNGVYHPDQYVTMPLIDHMFSMLCAMVTNDKMLAHGIGVTPYSKERAAGIKAAAKYARNFNQAKHGDLVAKIMSFSAEYRAGWPRLPDGADPAQWAPGPTGHFVRLGPGLRADPANRTIIVDGAAQEWPLLAMSWAKVRVVAGGSVAGLAIPARFTVIDDTLVDQLADLGL
jgi:hypothetical protein